MTTKNKEKTLIHLLIKIFNCGVFFAIPLSEPL